MQLVLFKPWIGANQVLPFRATVDLGAMAMNGVVRIPQICSIAGTPPSDCLVSYQDTRCGAGSYSFAEKQSVYSTAPDDWAKV